MTASAEQRHPAALSGPRKAAVFLMGMGDQVSAEVMKHLAPGEVRRITAEIAATRSVGSEQMLGVFREFEVLTAEGRLFAKGGADCARRLVEHAFGPESAQKLLDGPAPADPTAGSEVFHETDPRQLALLLRNEHPQTIAVVLSNLAPEAGGALMECLPEDTQTQVALRMASLDRISAGAFQRVAEAIGAKLKSIRAVNKANGLQTLASLLNHVRAERVQAILALMQEQNAQAADAVNSLMFVFDDLLGIDKDGMRALVAQLDRKVLTLALKGTSAKMREHFTQCMSQRSAEMLVEDMEVLGPVRIGDVKTAQDQVIRAIRELQAAGRVSTGGGDSYVV
jgi:flagellar motor switch protein FliG